MTNFRIIVEEIDRSHWTAWFAECPQLSCVGKFPRHAIDLLLEQLCQFAVDSENIRAVNQASKDGHFEFDIRLLDQHAEVIAAARMLAQIPKQSQN